MTKTTYKVGDKVRIINQSFEDCTTNAIIGSEAVIVRDFDGTHYRIRYKSTSGGKPRGYITPQSIEPYLQKPTKNQRITTLEQEVEALKAEVDEIKAAQRTEIKQRLARPKEAPSLSANEQRKAIIAEAKAFVAEYERACNSTTVYIGDTGNGLINLVSMRINFEVNAEKRAVTTLFYAKTDGTLRTKGIAKCAPTDVFNADIGKAIALGRALGLDVSKFEQAVQPSEVVVGMKVAKHSFVDAGDVQTISEIIENPNPERYPGVAFNTKGHYGWVAQSHVNLVDDTEAQY